MINKKKKIIIIGIVGIVIIGLVMLLFFPWEKAPEGIIIGRQQVKSRLKLWLMKSQGWRKRSRSHRNLRNMKIDFSILLRYH